MKATLVIATHNRGKLREFRTLLSTTGAEILGLDDVGIRSDHPESGRTFAQNAREKALAYSFQTALPVLADDSGLEVSALDGRPGIHSARYAGAGASDAERIAKLLAELEAAGLDRSARFVCAVAVARAGAILAEAEGDCAGVITREPLGEGGFGYDPVFLVPGLGKTYAQLAPEEKNRLSHRARAVAELLRRFDLDSVPS